MKKYQVIGGQYEQNWIGESDTLHGAKVIAGKNKEFWDNMKDWTTPKIYLAENCERIECNGWITKADGQETIVHKPDAEPVV